MFELWKLRRRRRKVFNAYEKDIEKLQTKKAPADERYALEAQQYFETNEIDQEIDREIGHRLHTEALELDVGLPQLKDEGMWIHDDNSNRVWLSASGRSQVRKLIDQEKGRRFEVTTRWVKLLLPIIAALAGLIGTITGLAAVLHKK
jgi:hypothetical protein